MNAKALITQLGDGAIGKRVMTDGVGDYPGGSATIIEVLPDPNAPEIVCQVRNDFWGEIGIFEHENLELLPAK